jgi:catechol 2,3-dioxygenase-like lactoylglutathione lyase family enzyme
VPQPNNGPSPRIAELGHIGVRCHDVERQLDFYTRILGLSLTDADPDSGTYFLSARPAAEHHELLLTKGRDVPAAGQLVQQISFRCPNLADVVGFYQRLIGESVEIDMCVSHGNAIGVYFYDPEHNRCEIYWQTGFRARQPFVEYIDLNKDPAELLEDVRRSADKYEASGYKEDSYRGWVKATGQLSEAPD